MDRQILTQLVMVEMPDMRRIAVVVEDIIGVGHPSAEVKPGEQAIAPDVPTQETARTSDELSTKPAENKQTAGDGVPSDPTAGPQSRRRRRRRTRRDGPDAPPANTPPSA